jgi:hypothetical protein
MSVTESIADCYKDCHSVTLTGQSQLILLKPLKMDLCSFSDGIPLKLTIFKNCQASVQIVSLLLLTTLRIRWTIPLMGRTFLAF